MISLFIMFAACTFGLAAVAIVMVSMGFAGAPGAALFEIGKHKQSLKLRGVGLFLTMLGQAYVNVGYAVLLVSVLRFYTQLNPNAWVWPLWFVAFFHSHAAPMYGMKEKLDTPQRHMLLEVSFITTVSFFVTVFFPTLTAFGYSWVPYFEYNFK